MVGSEPKTASPDAVGEDDGAGRVLEVILRTEEAAEHGARQRSGRKLEVTSATLILFCGAVAGECAVGDPDAAS